jgi:class 3 adenylate cyclase/tetratricopeptide (TPR) repeat protein
MNERTEGRFDEYLETNKTKIESAIHDLWVSKDESRWSREPAFYVKLGETADRLGQSMFAHDIFREGFGSFPEHLRIAQLYALSLIKCGFLEKARELLAGLVKAGHHDEETLGILARVYKDMWLIAGGGDPADRHILKSRALYLHAFKKSRGYYSGINAASLSRIVGDGELASKLAGIVRRICLHLLKEPAGWNYWVLATLGEAYLLLGDGEKSQKYYEQAKRHGAKNYAELASTLRQLRLLREHVPVREGIVNALAIPAVVAFTGHMIDPPGVKKPRFPAWIAQAVKDEIAARLDRLKAGISYSSAACGSDVLFLECMQRRGGETNVILPFNRDDFFRTSVEHAGPGWAERASGVLKESARIVQPTEGKYGGDDFLFAHANRIVMGEALLRGKMLESTPVLLAVWNGRKNGSEGGTSDFIARWESKKLPVEIVDIAAIRKRAGTGYLPPGAPEPPSGAREGPRGGRVKRALKAMLFADLVGYSKLTEAQLPSFYDSFLCELAENLRRSRHKPVFRNSWGDCIYFVFDDMVSAAECALELRDFVRTKNWKESNLPSTMNIRIGLHAGPVYHAWEPILNRMGYFGYHVTTAARIEPITSPGNVYASEQFAALLMAESGSGDLVCNYVGVIVLPKDFGKFPIFHIKRRREID